MIQRELEAKTETHLTVRRQLTEEPEEEEEEEESLIQRMQSQFGNRAVGQMLSRKAEGDAEVAPEVEDAIQRARGSGQALDGGVRVRMESALGADFGGVRVHTDAEADALNRAVSARAFTTGPDIFFKQGEYIPGSSGGRELLAYELTHVMQQNGDSVQRKLVIGQPNDRYEREADQMSGAVMRQEQQAMSMEADKGLVRRQTEEEEEELFRAKTEDSRAHSQIGEDETPVQRVAVDLSPAFQVPPVVQEVLDSPGQPLDPATRALMEPRFGHDFSQVRVHNDARSVESVQAVNALAYTVGRNVVFGAGQYQPQSEVGQQLLAHELTHVVQQEALAPGVARPVQRQRGGPRRTRAPRAQMERIILERNQVMRGWEREMKREAERWRGEAREAVRAGRAGREAARASVILDRIQLESAIAQIMGRYSEVSGMTGTVGEAKTPGQAAGVAVDFEETLAQQSSPRRGVRQTVTRVLWSGCVLITYIDKRATDVDIWVNGLQPLYEKTAIDWARSLPKQEYQLYALKDRRIRIGASPLIIGIATDEGLLQKYIDSTEMWIEPWKTISGIAPWPVEIQCRSGGKQLVYDPIKRVCRVEPAPIGAPDIAPPPPRTTIGPR